jgi:hypothetical protein
MIALLIFAEGKCDAIGSSRDIGVMFISCILNGLSGGQGEAASMGRAWNGLERGYSMP